MTDPTPPDSKRAPAGNSGGEATRTDARFGEAASSIGPYRLFQRIGEGGMGEVWLAEQAEPVRRRVALKIIKAGMDTRQVVARFEAERQTLALMDHPSIAKVFDAGETPQGRPYFVMEFVQGVPITDYCDRQRLANRERLDLFVQVCGAVQHAHQKAIIHRDLKPSNVLIALQDGKPVPKIIDFGVAKATSQRLTEKTMFTEMGVLIGTPEYMSPEQAEMTGQGVDTRTDVYALGVMLYELLVGALPFDPKELRKAGFEGILRKIRDEEPPKPSTRVSTLGDRSTESARQRRVDLRTLRSQLRGDLDWITMKALEKNRTRRYGSPSELAADLVRHMNDEPVLAGPPSATYRARKFVKRHRLGVGASAAAIVVLLGFAVAMAVQARRIAAEREASDQVSQFLANMLINVDPQTLGNTLWRDLHERVAEVRRGLGEPKERVSAALASLDHDLAGVNATDAALKLLDEQVLARAGESIERDLGREPRIAARLEYTLASTYVNLGLYGPAEVHAKRAVGIHERMLGREDPDTLRSMSRLAGVYYGQGRYAEAEKLFQETLESQRRILGQDNPDTLRSMSNLGNVYDSQGRYDEAVTLLTETLERRRHVLGPDHPDTLASMDNLAGTYYGQGRYAEAEKLYAETTDSERRTLGRDHPDTLRSMSNLAAVYFGEARYPEAERLYTEAIESERRALGQDHPNTLASMNNLAGVYNSEGRYAEAEKLFMVTIEGKRRVLGPDHPETLRSMSNLAEVYENQGRYREAEKLYSETIEGERRALGREHPDALTSTVGLAAVYKMEGRYAEAEKLLREALEIQRRVLGQEHPDTLESMYGLACVAARRGDRTQALDWLRHAVEQGFKGSDPMAKNDDLKALRGDPAFDSLVARARGNRAKPK